MEAVIPWLHLKGISTNDFGKALTALFGESVKGLSPATIARLKEGWEREYALSLVHQLAMSVQKRWRRLRGFRHLADVIADVRFTDGVEEKKTGRRAAGFETAIHQI